MKQYLDLLREILETGRIREDRTGTGTIGIFDAKLKYDLSKGEFPLLTTKFVPRKAAWLEYQAILNGELHLESLPENGVKFWDPWRVGENHLSERTLANYERIDWMRHNAPDLLREWEVLNVQAKAVALGHQWLDDHGVPRTEDIVTTKKGDLNAPYGPGWRNFSENPTRRQGIDQVQYALDLLRHNPTSRRILISAWNPMWMPDEKISPQQNVIAGNPCLTACHWAIEFYVETMTLQERLSWCASNANPYFQDVWEDHMSDHYAEEHCDQPKMSAERKAEWLTEMHVPTQWLSLKWHQRSVDYNIGEPVNQVFYAFMLLSFAHEVGMAAHTLVGDLTNVHLYLNTLEEAKLQLGRAPYKPVECYVRSEHYYNAEVPKKGLFELTYEDFIFTKYEHHPAIKLEVSV